MYSLVQQFHVIEATLAMSDLICGNQMWLIKAKQAVQLATTETVYLYSQEMQRKDRENKY